MCLIIHRAAGAEIPANLIQNGMSDNPHGWGIMLARENKVVTSKGTKMEDFPKALLACGDAPLTIHFRFATHGTINDANCHPFPILKGKYALMHNGVISIPCEDKSRSDTYHFAERILTPILAHSPESFGTEYLSSLLGSLVGTGNKLVILRNDGASMLVNRAQGHEMGGLWLSNTNSLPGGGRLRWDDSDWKYTGHPWKSARGTYSGNYVSQYEDVSGEDECDEEKEDTLAYRVPEKLTEMQDWYYDEIEQFVSSNPEYIADLITDHLAAYDFGRSGIDAR